MTSSFLIVDADRNFRDALAIALRLDGHEAAVAVTADDARARLGARPFACCVVDTHLAGADSVLEAAEAAGVRAVVTGPYAELLASTAARHPGVVTLAKPFRALDLLRLLDGPTRAAG